MSNSRVSNKQLLEAVEAQTAAMTQLIAALTPTTQPKAEVNSVAVEAEAAPAKPEKIKVSEAYFNAMLPKWQSLANSKGVTYVGYAYRKSNGKVGLWAVPKEQLAAKQRTASYLGNVVEVNPA